MGNKKKVSIKVKKLLILFITIKFFFFFFLGSGVGYISTTIPEFLVLLGILLSSPDSTSPPGSNQTDLATSRCSSLYGGSLSNMLMVTTTVGMLYRVHRHTTDLRPVVPLNLVLVIGSTSLQDRLVNTSTTSDTSNHGSVGGWDHFLGS